MTIQFFNHWNGNDGIKTLAPAEEARLVGLGIARDYTEGMDGQSGVPMMGTELPGGGFQANVGGEAVELRGFKNQRLIAAAEAIRLGHPADFVIFGDSTADTLDEWYGLLATQVAAGVGAGHSVAYRQWSDVAQRYSGAQYLAVGPNGRRYIAAGQATTSHRVELTSTTATTVTGDLDVRFLVDLQGGGITVQAALGGKYGAAGQRGWRLELTSANALFFEHSSDGTNQISRTSTAIPGGLLTGLVWLRVLLDVDNGSAGNTATFFTSLNGVDWTVLSTSTLAGVTSVFSNTTSLQFIGRGGSSVSSIGRDIRFYEMQVWAGSQQVAWVDAGSVPSRSTLTSQTYVDDLGNPGTMFFQGSTVGGDPRVCFFNGSVGGQTIAYAIDASNANARFNKMAAGRFDVVYINYSHNEAATNTYAAQYKTLTDLIISRNEFAGVVGVLQNRRFSPASGIDEHSIRVQAVRRFCAAANFATLDVWGVVTASEMRPDGVHPEAASGVFLTIAENAYRALFD
jgi:hypothetical protein